MSFKNLLNQFCTYDFSENEAAEHWYQILTHQKELETVLRRPVGFVVAVTDYLMHRLKKSDQLVLVESESYKKTKDSALRDPLTGLYNRGFLRDYLDREFDKAKRYPISFSILFLDVDHFKKINDTYGHLGGDHILQQVARILMKCSRGADLAVRYGGEEFVVVMYQALGRNAINVAERIRKRIEKELFHVPGIPEPTRITLSGGLATCPQDAEDPDSLLKCADEALYMAKLQGRNRICQNKDIANKMPSCVNL